MDVFYLISILTIGTDRGPEYFVGWARDYGTVTCDWAMMDYGFSPSALLVAKDISQTDQDFLAAQPDVFRFPGNLDGPVNQDIGAFFEGVHLPTDWLTPATTWRELLRQVAGMFLFNQRYMGIAANETGELHSVFDNATLDTRQRELTAQEIAWFRATVDSFGFDSSVISTNSRLRQLVKSAAGYWAGQTFYIGGVAF